MENNEFITFEGKIQAENIHHNTGQNVIVITEDRVRLLLNTHREALQGNLFWITPFGIFLSLLVTDLTATFSDKAGISKSTWEAMFYISTAGFFCWTVIAVSKISKRKSVDDLVGEMKKKKAE